LPIVDRLSQAHGRTVATVLRNDQNISSLADAIREANETMNITVILTLSLIAALVLVPLWFIATRNWLNQLRLQVYEATGVLAHQLRQRLELMPDLEAAVDYAVRAQMEYLEMILGTRLKQQEWTASAGASVNLPPELGPLLEIMSRAPRGAGVVESNPPMDVSPVVKLQDGLIKIEDDIGAARRLCESAVSRYNLGLVSFPSSAVANAMGLAPIPNTILTDDLKVRPDLFGGRRMGRPT